MKYISIEHYSGAVIAYRHDEDWRTALDHPDAAEWVWQDAGSRGEAIGRHYMAHGLWEQDMASGEPVREVY